jgi:phosphatidylglycerol:prolipoprotein diacylglycerol transferase
MPIMVSDVVFFGALGVILGGRFGYALFYNLGHYISNPLEILKVWQGGMSFHGGLIGVLIAMWYVARRHGKQFLEVTDFVAPWAPVGLGLGRIANFINGELWGRVTDVPWAMVFPGAGPAPRHPSQLYQATLEGLVLLIVLVWYSRTPRPIGRVSGLFGLLYGSFRFLVEFAREPDAHIGFIAFQWLTMGQLLSLPLIALGAWLLFRKVRHPLSVR